MAFNDDNTELLADYCNYLSLAHIPINRFVNSLFHMNVRSLAPKIGEIESLIILLGNPKIFLLSET